METLEKSRKSQLLEKIESLTSGETQGLPTVLGLSNEKNYMITNNLITEDGLVYGTIGTLEE